MDNWVISFMRNKIITVIAVLIFVCPPLYGQVGRNPVETRNPVGTGRMPVYGLGSDITRVPNPIDTSMNLVVTGNITGGRHFRGVVPYQDSRYFTAPLGSTSLDSFLRRSAGVGNFDNIPMGGFLPYYSSTQTVTTTRPGLVTVLRPPIASSTGIASGMAHSPMSSAQRSISIDDNTLGGQFPTKAYSRYRPMSMTPHELELRVSKTLGRLPLGGKDMDMPDEESIAEYRQKMQEISDQALELKRRITQPEEPGTETELTDDLEKLRAEQRIKALEQRPVPERKLDVYEQMRLEIEAPVDELADEQEISEKSLQERIAEVSLLVAKARAIRGKHKSFATYSKDKFNEYMRKAENFLKEAKYYKAADAYTLALMFKPDDPLAYAGKSHALFASGEYMSSSLFLQRALDIFPEYAAFKIDLVAMVGDKDQLESRISDVRLWLAKSDAAELHFLIAYIYYQMGRPPEAVTAIDKAYEKMPEVRAVIVLREAIHAASKTK